MIKGVGNMDKIIRDEIGGKGLVKLDKADLLAILDSANSISQVMIESDDIERVAKKELAKIKGDITGMMFSVTAKRKSKFKNEMLENIVESFKPAKNASILWGFRVDPKIEKQYRLSIIIGKK